MEKTRNSEIVSTNSMIVEYFGCIDEYQIDSEFPQHYFKSSEVFQVATYKIQFHCHCLFDDSAKIRVNSDQFPTHWLKEPGFLPGLQLAFDSVKYSLLPLRK